MRMWRVPNVTETKITSIILVCLSVASHGSSLRCWSYTAQGFSTFLARARPGQVSPGSTKHTPPRTTAHSLWGSSSRVTEPESPINRQFIHHSDNPRSSVEKFCLSKHNLTSTSWEVETDKVRDCQAGWSIVVCHRSHYSSHEGLPGSSWKHAGKRGPDKARWTNHPLSG